MKRIVAWLLLFIFLCGTTEAHELLKLPMLFGHYTEHQAKQADLSFLDYLSDHYFGNATHSHSHDNLPFQGNHDNHTLEAPIDQPVPHQFCFFFAVIHAHHNTPLITFFPEGSNTAVWQPPKF